MGSYLYRYNGRPSADSTLTWQDVDMYTFNPVESATLLFALEQPPCVERNTSRMASQIGARQTPNPRTAQEQSIQKRLSFRFLLLPSFLPLGFLDLTVSSASIVWWIVETQLGQQLGRGLLSSRLGLLRHNGPRFTSLQTRDKGLENPRSNRSRAGSCDRS